MAQRKLGSVKSVDVMLITSASLTADVTGVLPVANGGTGSGSFTDGQLLIGNTSGNTLAKNTLTQGAGTTITNGAGTITIATSGSHVAAYFASEVDNGNSGTADTIDWTLGNKQKSTLTGNCTYTFTAPTGQASIILRVIQDATGSRTVTWPATVKWSGGTAPTLTTAANKIDIIAFYWDGTSYYGTSSLNY